MAPRGAGARTEAVAEELERPHGGGVVFVGPSGAGKTRLLTECRRLAEGIGFASVAIRPTRTAAAIRFGAVAPFLPAGGPVSDAGLLRGAVRAISDTAAGRPLLVVVDDAHLLDDGSATVLAQVVAEGRAFVAGAVRSGEPTPDSVVGLWKEGRARRVEVEPLAAPLLTSLLESVLGGPIESATAWLLWQQTGGNPLFLRELLRAATEAGALRQQDGIWRLTRGPITSSRLVELVEQRVRDLADEYRLALALVAFGEPIAVGIVEAACGTHVPEALERQHLIVVESDGARIEARLPHQVYGDALRSSAPPLLARAAFRILIDAVRGAGARRWNDQLRLAGWTLERGDPLDPVEALRAAREAAAGSAFGLAARLARRALEGGGGAEAALLLSEVLGYDGNLEESDAVIAAIEGSLTTDDEVMALAVNRSAHLFAVGQDDAAFEVQRWAVGRVKSAAAQSELACLLAGYELQLADPAGAFHRVEPFLEGPISRATVRAAIVAGLALPLLGRTREAVALSDRQLGRHAALHRAPLVVDPALHAVYRSLALCYAGRPADALSHIEATHRASIEEGGTRVQAGAALELARAHLLLGNVSDAVRFGREGAVLTGELGRGLLTRWCLTLVALAQAMGGDVAAAEEALAAAERLARGHRSLMDSEVDRARGWIAFAKGDTAGARSSFVSAARVAGTTGELVLEVVALHDLARLGDAEAAAGRLAELAGIVDGALARACAADTAARRGEDPTAMEAAAAEFEAMAMRLHAAESLVAAARAWARAGDARAASRCERRARALARSCHGAATPVLAGLGSDRGVVLSVGELDVAVLVAEGLANREIAERLYLSVRTVENRLQRTYRKLGVRDRALLADVLREVELT